ncbi:hypothetical protein AWC05_13295 [Mycobacterium florentinum]|uniref:DUF732 domain-containing protein n=1 Tax=Mycobacterium florentinum TaxID=292462 RepID=A0A1X1UDH9_MYCFL|nr:DUF732 domain-containing protein [Mycobacterium florentinum]MCV7412172.1 DUF732 domain-containing protein [Mycobacterium florentinum]ORV54864.1 hypothetical protein AWC05_13295 [Mycobacterium florentinum]BBX81547.1 hypothetical protein MFLOJ_53340 [Mycobacterium florentinum]
MTALMMYRPWTVRRSTEVHQPTVWADFINAAAAALRPLAVAAGILTAGAALPALAQADPSPDPITPALNGMGNGTNGSVTNSLAGIGQSICPALVKPGATLASVTSQLGLIKGLPPNMAGMVASMAIQMECPGVMTSLANGKMPFPMQLPGANPFPLPGAGPAAPAPFALPGR